MHSFREGGPESLSPAGAAAEGIMSLVGWKCAGVANKYTGATRIPPRKEEETRELRTSVRTRTWTRTSCPRCQKPGNGAQLSHIKALEFGSFQRVAHIARMRETVRRVPNTPKVG